MTALGELAEVFDLRCCRCGKPGPDTVEDAAALERLLNPRALPGHAGILTPSGIRTIHQADIDAVRPVHKRCPGQVPPPGGGQKNRDILVRQQSAKAPYDLLRSVA